MKLLLKKFTIGLMILLTAVFLPSVKQIAAQSEQVQQHEPKNWSEPESDELPSFWKYVLITAGSLLTVGLIASLVGGSDDSSSGSETKDSNDTGGFSGSW